MALGVSVSVLGCVSLPGGSSMSTCNWWSLVGEGVSGGSTGSVGLMSSVDCSQGGIGVWVAVLPWVAAVPYLCCFAAGSIVRSRSRFIAPAVHGGRGS
eukprot:609129-Amphidinium_carterae.1